MIDKVKSIIRPLISLIFAISMVIGTFKGLLPVEGLIGLATMAITFWFKSRDEEKGVRK